MESDLFSERKTKRTNQQREEQPSGRVDIPKHRSSVLPRTSKEEYHQASLALEQCSNNIEND